MALFFDADFFDAALKARGLTRKDAARAMRLDEEQLAEIWKDQRQLQKQEMALLAQLCGVALDEAAKRAGVAALDVPLVADSSLQASLARIEQEMRAIRQLLEKLLMRD